VGTKDIGDIAEAVVTAELMKRGKKVLKPIGDNARYDLVIDEDGFFKRIQVKNGRLVDDAVRFATCSTYGHRGRSRRTYEGEIEYFAVYCPENNKSYLVPMDATVGKAKMALRLTPSRNNQQRGVRWAKDYEI